MRRIKYILAAFVIAILLLLVTNTYKAVYSITVSYIIPVDDKYIIEKGEWLGDNQGIISLYDKSDSLSNNIVYRAGKPTYKIKRLNKYFNSFVATRLDDGQTDVFTYTGEFTK